MAGGQASTLTDLADQRSHLVCHIDRARFEVLQEASRSSKNGASSRETFALGRSHGESRGCDP